MAQHLFKVPNNEEGKAFLALAKKYINKQRFSLKKRGRGKNRKEVALKAGYALNHCNDIRIPFAEYFGVYIIFKKAKKV